MGHRCREGLQWVGEGGRGRCRSCAAASVRLVRPPTTLSLSLFAPLPHPSSTDGTRHDGLKGRRPPCWPATPAGPSQSHAPLPLHGSFKSCGGGGVAVVFGACRPAPTCSHPHCRWTKTGKGGRFLLAIPPPGAPSPPGEAPAEAPAEAPSSPDGAAGRRGPGRRRPAHEPPAWAPAGACFDIPTSNC